MSGLAHNDKWRVFDYEATMLLALSKYLSEDDLAKFDWAVGNAIVESAVLHTRVLAELLLSRGRMADDIRLKDLLPSLDTDSLRRLGDAYGDQKREGSPCWQFNKLLAHATIQRSDRHNYT
jgi:hypothetical protein